MWTGDIAPHDIWNVTRHEVLSQIKLVTNLMKQYTRVPVYPVIGNHEGVPVNRYSTHFQYFEEPVPTFPLTINVENLDLQNYFLLKI